MWFFPDFLWTLLVYVNGMSMCTRYVPFCRALIDLFVIVCCSWFFCVREHAAGSFLQGVDCLVRNCVLFFGFSMSEKTCCRWRSSYLEKIIFLETHGKTWGFLPRTDFFTLFMDCPYASPYWIDLFLLSIAWVGKNKPLNGAWFS
jgi:hypothetical protein